MNTLGGTTTTLFFKGFSGDNLYEEFVTTEAIKAGQFVKLANDGKVSLHAANENSAFVIGVAFADAASGGVLTVAMKGYGTLMAEGSASMNAGPAKFVSFTSGTGYNRVIAAAETSNVMDKAMVGWALDASVSAGDVVRLVICN